MAGKTYRVDVGCGHLYVTVNNDDKDYPFEVFSHIGKCGGCSNAQSEAVCRLISLCLRSGIGIDEVIKQLKNIKCSSPKMTSEGTVFSCPDAISKALSKHIGQSPKTESKEFSSGYVGCREVQEVKNNNAKSEGVKGYAVCPECGEQMIFQEGCVKCPSCFYTRCG